MHTILLHGLGQTPASWDAVLAAWTPASPPLRPSLAELLQGGEARYDRLYQAFSAFCADLPAPVDLCGLSLGGILALHYAADHPDRVDRLVLIGAQYVMPKRLLRVQSLLFRCMPESSFRGMGLPKRDVLSLTGSMAELDFRAALPKIPCPALVVCGERDKANRQAAQELAEQLPRAELRILPGAGHEVNVDAPQALAKLLSDFLDGPA